LQDIHLPGWRWGFSAQANALFARPAWVAREWPLLFGTRPDYTICDVIYLPEFCNTNPTIRRSAMAPAQVGGFQFTKCRKPAWKGSSPTAANEYMDAVAKHILVGHPHRAWVGRASPMPTLPYPSSLPTPNAWNPDKADGRRNGYNFLHWRWRWRRNHRGGSHG
jgi:hypothetical protein